MPAKKIKTKPAKKSSVKKINKKPSKKISAKKPTVKKLVKKTATKKAPIKLKTKKVKIEKKPLKKIAKPVKKIVAKALKKPDQKVVKKLTKAVEKKIALKKQKDDLSTKTGTGKHSLAKKILAKTPREKKPEPVKEVEKKKDHPQKAIIVRKSEGRNKANFKVGEYAVYPSHGVGKIVEIEKTAILGQDLSCYLMCFEKEKLNIKIPTNSAEKIGLRHLVTKSQMDEVFSILRSGVKKLKGMWSRRAQEYETKINSGDIMLLAEVLRDLTRDIEDSERSYSERIIYETAIYRLASEYNVIYGITLEEAKEKVTMTAKDKLNSEGKVIQKDEFDEFDLDVKSDLDEDDDEESENEDDDEDDDYGDDEDDEKPRRKSKK